MSDFHPVEAALSGFRLMRREPWAVVIWGVIHFIGSVAVGLATIALVGDRLATLVALTKVDAAVLDPTELVRAVMALLPFLVVFLAVNVVSRALVFAAIYRSHFQPEESAYGWVRFGRQELQMLFVLVILPVMFMAYMIFLLVLLKIGLEGAKHLLGQKWSVLPQLGMIGAFVAAVIYPVVRFSLAAPATFDTGVVHIFASWKLTRGQVWPLCISYVLAFLITVIISIGALVLFVLAASLLGLLLGWDASATSAIFHPDASSVAHYFSGVSIAYLVFAGMLEGLNNALILGPSAEAYLAFHGPIGQGEYDR